MLDLTASSSPKSTPTPALATTRPSLHPLLRQTWPLFSHKPCPSLHVAAGLLSLPHPAPTLTTAPSSTKPQPLKPSWGSSKPKPPSPLYSSTTPVTPFLCPLLPPLSQECPTRVCSKSTASAVKSPPPVFSRSKPSASVLALQRPSVLRPSYTLVEGDSYTQRVIGRVCFLPRREK